MDFIQAILLGLVQGFTEFLPISSSGHVEIGTRWFRYCCGRQNLEPEATFLTLLETRYGGSVRGPFNLAARYEAGFSAEEMRALETL